MVAHQDFELAEQFMKADFSVIESDYKEDGELDGKKVGKQLFQLEGIFLDLTDRTLSHPRVPYAHEDKGGKFANLVKEFGLGNRKIIWKPSDLFDLDKYMDAYWFPEQLEMYHKAFNEMLDAKRLYSKDL